MSIRQFLVTIDTDKPRTTVEQGIVTALRSAGAHVQGAREVENCITGEDDSPLMPAGKYAGKSCEQVPEDYLAWLAGQEFVKYGKWAIVSVWLRENGYELN